MVKPLSQRAVEGFQNKRRFPGAGHTGDADQTSQRESYLNIFEIILRCALEDDFTAVSGSPFRGHRNAFAAGKVLSGQ